jgi:hypothetical protein
MAVGIGSLIGAAVGIGGSLLSSRSQNRATDRAAETATNTANQNNALQAAIYGQNAQALGGYNQRGNAAGNRINAMLGLGGSPMDSPQMGGAQVRPNALVAYGGGYQGNAQYGGYQPQMNDGGFVNEPPPYIYSDPGQGQQQGGQTYGGVYSPDMIQGGYQQPQGGMQGTVNAQGGAEQAQFDAFDGFRNSTNYQFRLNEGNRGLNASYAGRGLANSGAAAKAAIKYNQNFASNELGNYMNLLSNQQGVGLSAASAQAGVGQNYANSVSANNNNAGNAQANALLLQGQNNANMWGNFANVAGQFASSFR